MFSTSSSSFGLAGLFSPSLFVLTELCVSVVLVPTWAQSVIILLFKLIKQLGHADRDRSTLIRASAGVRISKSLKNLILMKLRIKAGGVAQMLLFKEEEGISSQAGGGKSFSPLCCHETAEKPRLNLIDNKRNVISAIFLVMPLPVCSDGRRLFFLPRPDCSEVDPPANCVSKM